MKVVQSFKSPTGLMYMKTVSSICGFECFNFYREKAGGISELVKLSEAEFLMEEQRLILSEKQKKNSE